MATHSYDFRPSHASRRRTLSKTNVNVVMIALFLVPCGSAQMWGVLPARCRSIYNVRLPDERASRSRVGLSCENTTMMCPDEWVTRACECACNFGRPQRTASPTAAPTNTPTTRSRHPEIGDSVTNITCGMQTVNSRAVGSFRFVAPEPGATISIAVSSNVAAQPFGQWSISVSDDTDSSIHVLPMEESALFSITSSTGSGCSISSDGNCVSSAKPYRDGDHCDISVNSDAELTAVDFHTELYNCSDKVTINARHYCGPSRFKPVSVAVDASSQIEWSTDHMAPYPGWTICGALRSVRRTYFLPRANAYRIQVRESSDLGLPTADDFIVTLNCLATNATTRPSNVASAITPVETHVQTEQTDYGNAQHTSEFTSHTSVTHTATRFDENVFLQTSSSLQPDINAVATTSQNEAGLVNHEGSDADRNDEADRTTLIVAICMIISLFFMIVATLWRFYKRQKRKMEARAVPPVEVESFYFSPKYSRSVLSKFEGNNTGLAVNSRSLRQNRVNIKLYNSDKNTDQALTPGSSSKQTNTNNSRRSRYRLLSKKDHGSPIYSAPSFLADRSQINPSTNPIFCSPDSKISDVDHTYEYGDINSIRTEPNDANNLYENNAQHPTVSHHLDADDAPAVPPRMLTTIAEKKIIAAVGQGGTTQGCNSCEVDSHCAQNVATDNNLMASPESNDYKANSNDFSSSTGALVKTGFNYAAMDQAQNPGNYASMPQVFLEQRPQTNWEIMDVAALELLL